MARHKQNRVLQQPPKVKGFNPIGFYSSKTNCIHLNFEEFESIRLIDYENLTQEQASSYMKISRPTLTRIYESARKKLGKVLVEANQLLIDGGNFIFKENWFECKKCECKFNNPDKSEITSCIICNSKQIELLQKS